MLEHTDTGKSIRSYLKTKGYSGKNLAKIKNDGEILFNGEAQRLSDWIVNTGKLEIRLSPGVPSEIKAVKMPLSVCYEDDDYLIVDKPCNMPCHPVHGHLTDTLANAVMWKMRQQNENATIRIVNRLDRNTTGLVCFAKTSYAASAIHGASSKTHKESGHCGMQKEYLALCHGRIERPGSVFLPVRKKEDSMMQREISVSGMYAATHFEPLLQVRDATLLRLWLETGRTHQIRVHLAGIGHPLVGDDLYGGRPLSGMERHALHCSDMHFFHPVKEEYITVTAGMPADMHQAVVALVTETADLE